MWTPFQAGSLLLYPKGLPYPTLPYPAVAQGTKFIDIPGYRIYKDIEVVETQTSLEFS